MYISRHMEQEITELRNGLRTIYAAQLARSKIAICIHVDEAQQHCLYQHFWIFEQYIQFQKQICHNGALYKNNPISLLKLLNKVVKLYR